jgi:hypothetical protein
LKAENTHEQRDALPSFTHRLFFCAKTIRYIRNRYSREGNTHRAYQCDAWMVKAQAGNQPVILSQPAYVLLATLALRSLSPSLWAQLVRVTPQQPGSVSLWEWLGTDLAGGSNIRRGLTRGIYQVINQVVARTQ